MSKMNFSFSGCGFLGLYHIGAASCIKTYAPHLCNNKMAGASAGAMAAMSMLVDVPLGEVASQILEIAKEARKHTMGPFSSSFNITELIRKGLHEHLPQNVHLQVSGRLYISLTKVYDGSNILVSEYASKHELIEVLLASAFIPIFSGWIPLKYRGTRVIDGGYSDNLPILDSETVTVSPFSGGCHISPRDDLDPNVMQMNIANTPVELSTANLMRLRSTLLPPDVDVLSTYCKQGFEDALNFLQSKYLIACTKCLTVDSTFQVGEDAVFTGGCENDGNTFNPDCFECKLYKSLAKESSVPPGVWEVFERAIQEAEMGAKGWVEYFTSYKVIKVLTYPAALPVGVAKRILFKLQNVIQSELNGKGKVNKMLEVVIAKLQEYVSEYAPGVYPFTTMSYSNKYTCEANITEYGVEETPYGSLSKLYTSRDCLNVEFQSNLRSDSLQKLPKSQAEARLFQKRNFNTAVNSPRHSCAVSRGPASRAQSTFVSRAGSRGTSRIPSRMGTRTNSMDSLLPDSGFESDLSQDLALQQISKMTENQDAVMSFFYTDEDNQVKVLEIFDVTSSAEAESLLDEKQENPDESEDQGIYSETEQESFNIIA